VQYDGVSSDDDERLPPDVLPAIVLRAGAAQSFDALDDASSEVNKGVGRPAHQPMPLLEMLRRPCLHIEFVQENES
jgi:hypothetical protein